MLDVVADRVAQRAPSGVLEFGVGSGSLTRRPLDRLPEVSLIGIDFSPAMVEGAPAGPGIELVEHDLSVLPLPREARGCDVAMMS